MLVFGVSLCSVGELLLPLTADDTGAPGDYALPKAGVLPRLAGNRAE